VREEIKKLSLLPLGQESFIFPFSVQKYTALYFCVLSYMGVKLGKHIKGSR
jgi:hypothetical protein